MGFYGKEEQELVFEAMRIPNMHRDYYNYRVPAACATIAATCDLPLSGW